MQILVYGQADLGETVYIGDDGTVPVALVGAVPVSGLSPSGAAKRIENALREGKFVNDPHVTLTVVKSRNQLVSILGEVRSPGRYPVDSRMTVLDVLAQAGGISESTGGDVVELIRANGDGTTTRYPINVKGISDGNTSVLDQALQGGDTLFVPVAAKFFVEGEVKSTGKYRLEPGMSVRQAIARAGGITPQGSMHRVDITHKDAKGQVTHHAKLDDPVQAEDVIRVKESIF